jgi:GDP-L-fucose synthase
MKILVTGATGFLGTRLCAALEARGDNVTRIHTRAHNLRDPGALDTLVKPFDTIFHLAAWTQAGDFCLKHPGEQWLINQQINTTVLSWWARHQPEAKLISMGTSCAYDPSIPLVEENYLLGSPITGLYTYAMGKRMLHIGQLALHKQYGLRYLTLVPSTLYGSGYHTDGRQMHFIFDLVRKILKASMGGEAPVLWGDGYQRRELIHANDFVNAALQLAERHDNELFNVGSGEEFSIRHFASLICDLVGYNFAEIQFDTSRYVGATSKCLDVTKLRSQESSIRLTPLADGLAETIRWFRSNSATTL